MSSAFPASGANKPKKIAYFSKLRHLVTTHTQVLIVEADNVGSRQIAEIRYALRGKAELLMGKNTMIRTCLRAMYEEHPKLESLVDLVHDNIGMMFCTGDPAEIRQTVVSHRVPAPAKQGAAAPSDVYVPPGATGMDPGQTSFFQSLGIATKIVKGQIEIQSEVHIIKKGERVTPSQATLLQKLNIRPFSYGLKTITVWDDGNSYPASMLDIGADEIGAALKAAVSTVASLSLGAQYPTKCSAPHSIINAFRQVAGLALATDYSFPQLEALKAALANPAASASPVAAAHTKEAKKEEAPPPEEEEEEEGDMGFSLFD